MPRLAGKNAVVTGAASEIGKATGELFAAEGAHVIDTDIVAGVATRQHVLEPLAGKLESFGGECACGLRVPSPR